MHDFGVSWPDCLVFVLRVLQIALASYEHFSQWSSNALNMLTVPNDVRQVSRHVFITWPRYTCSRHDSYDPGMNAKMGMLRLSIF